MLRVALLAVFVVCVSAKCLLTGVNQAGADFGGNVPGTLYTDYIYPTTSADYFIAKGVNFFRLPFLWERVVQTKGGAWRAADIQALTNSVNYMTGKGAYVVLDPHDYGRGWGQIIGQGTTTIADFANFWKQLATQFKSNPKVMFGLINEPHDQDVNVWRSAAQAAINAIRSVGATQTIFVPGIAWTGAHSWVGSGNDATMWDIYDPMNNWAIEVHQYLDSDSSGQSPVCVSSTIGSTRLKDFTAWARSKNLMAFLGEFGASVDPTCLAGLNDMLTYMDANTDVWLGWTYWAGGPWWGNNQYTIQPYDNGKDTGQWAALVNHINPSIPSSVVVGKQTPGATGGAGGGSTTGTAKPATPVPSTPKPATPKPATAKPATPKPATAAPGSPSCTVIPAGSTGTITDSQGNVWGVSSGGQLIRNGVVDTLTARVTVIAYVQGIFWQENADRLWWSWNNGWTGLGTSTSPIASCGTVVCGRANEGSSLSITCPNTSQVVKQILFASWGTATGTCPGPFALSATCHATNSWQKAKDACVGKNSCSISASNGVFGDPCYGTGKSLALEVICQ